MQDFGLIAMRLTGGITLLKEWPIAHFQSCRLIMSCGFRSNYVLNMKIGLKRVFNLAIDISRCNARIDFFSAS